MSYYDDHAEFFGEDPSGRDDHRLAVEYAAEIVVQTWLSLRASEAKHGRRVADLLQALGVREPNQSPPGLPLVVRGHLIRWDRGIPGLVIEPCHVVNSVEIEAEDPEPEEEDP